MRALFRSLLTIPTTLQRVEGKIDLLLIRTKNMSQSLDNLKAAVAAQTTVDASAKALIEGIAKQLAAVASSSNDADLQSLSDQLTAASAPLAAAVTANTPAATPAT